MSAWEKDSDVVENIQEKEDDGRMSDVWRKLRFISHHFRSTLLFLKPLHGLFALANISQANS